MVELNSFHTTVPIPFPCFQMVWKGIIFYIRKIFRKTNISYLLIRNRMYAYQGVRNISFSKKFRNVLNEQSQMERSQMEHLREMG